MKTAKELLQAYLQNIQNPDVTIDLFSEDATIELPYLNSLGKTWQWSGKKEIAPFLQNLSKSFSGFEFKNVQIHIETPDQVFGEYEVDCIVASTGRPYHQHYMGRLVVENGKIILLREAMDMIQVAKSVLPNGISDLSKL